MISRALVTCARTRRSRTTLSLFLYAQSAPRAYITKERKTTRLRSTQRSRWGGQKRASARNYNKHAFINDVKSETTKKKTKKLAMLVSTGHWSEPRGGRPIYKFAPRAIISLAFISLFLSLFSSRLPIARVHSLSSSCLLPPTMAAGDDDDDDDDAPQGVVARVSQTSCARFIARLLFTRDDCSRREIAMRLK